MRQTTPNSSQIPQIFCSSHQSEDETLNLVCLNMECANAGLFCRLCSKKNHNDHTVINFKKLIKDLEGCHFAQNKFAHTQYEAGVDAQKKNKELKACAIEEILLTKQRVLRCFESLEQYINHKYEENRQYLEQRMEGISKYSIQEYSFGPSDTIRQINPKINKMVKTVRDHTPPLELFEGVSNFFDKLKKNIASKLASLVATIEQELSNVEALINLKPTVPTPQPLIRGPPGPQPTTVLTNSGSSMLATKFSNIDKHLDFHINGPVATRTQETIHALVCVTGEAAPVMESNKVYRWRLKLHSQGNCAMYVGVALQNTLRGYQYCGFFDGSQISHGHYLVSSNGHTYSHSSRHDNNVSHSDFNFGIDDVVQVQLDTKNFMLTFMARNKTLSLKMSGAPSGDCYRFVVYLYYTGDSVQLLP